jgi:hypothetical protein
MSTSTLVQLCMGLLLLEELYVPVTRWIKPIIVIGFYSLGALGVSSPAVYLISYGKLKKRDHDAPKKNSALKTTLSNQPRKHRIAEDTEKILDRKL